MTHTDTDIAEILERFDEEFDLTSKAMRDTYPHIWRHGLDKIKDFISHECLALKKKWEREKADNQ